MVPPVGDTVFDNEHNRIVRKANTTQNENNKKRTYADVVKMNVKEDSTKDGTDFHDKNRIMRNKKMISWKRDH